MNEEAVSSLLAQQQQQAESRFQAQLQALQADSPATETAAAAVVNAVRNAVTAVYTAVQQAVTGVRRPRSPSPVCNDAKLRGPSCEAWNGTCEACHREGTCTELVCTYCQAGASKRPKL